MMKSYLSILCFYSFCYCAYSEDILRLVQIVHRHGDRTPIEFRGDDTFSNETYWPQGFGELVNKGKQRMFNKGQFIRENYADFLTNDHKEIHIRSSSAERCLESVSYLLAGVYPPKDDWIWSNNTKIAKLWQAFPIQTVPEGEDTMLHFSVYCPVIARIFENIKHLSNYSQDFQKYVKLFDIIEDNLNVTIRDFYFADDLADQLLVENENGYLHEWLNKTEYEVLKQMRRVTFRYIYGNPVVSRLKSGVFVKEIISNMNKTIEGKNKKKLFVYSTHDSMIASYMYSMGFYNDYKPPYGAMLMFELYERNETLSSNETSYYVKIWYHNSTSLNMTQCTEKTFPCPDLQQIEIPSCGYACNFSQFERNYKHLFIHDLRSECHAQHHRHRSHVTYYLKGVILGVGVTLLVVIFIISVRYLISRSSQFRGEIHVIP